MQNTAEGNLWCHTCKSVFRQVIDDSFNYRCPCGSEFIEEITNANDPRLFDNLSMVAQPGTSHTNRMDIESPSQSMSLSSRSSGPIQEIVNEVDEIDLHSNNWTPDDGGHESWKLWQRG